MDKLTSIIDETRLLTFERGWIHVNCGGDAERSPEYGIAYCISCGQTVPVKQVGRLLADEIDKRYNMTE